MPAFAAALADAGGANAPRERLAQLRTLLEAELARGAAELHQARSGYADPVSVLVARRDDLLLGVAPVAPELRADPDAVPERAWLLTAALVGALVEAGGGTPLRAAPAAPDGLALAVPSADPDAAELAALAFEDHVAPVDRLRARALAVPPDLLDLSPADLREPIGARHPLRVAEAIARVHGRPADPRDAERHEEAVLALLQTRDHAAPTRPHDDPDPARRAARRILQRLDGMGKWGGYHTEFSHLARGFQGNDRRLAEDVGERLLDAGLLAEKPSVGQRHVFLNPRRARDVRALIERGTLPPGLHL